MSTEVDTVFGSGHFPFTSTALLLVCWDGRWELSSTGSGPFYLNWATAGMLGWEAGTLIHWVWSLSSELCYCWYVEMAGGNSHPLGLLPFTWTVLLLVCWDGNGELSSTGSGPFRLNCPTSSMLGCEGGNLIHCEQRQRVSLSSEWASGIKKQTKRLPVWWWQGRHVGYLHFSGWTSRLFWNSRVTFASSPIPK